MTLDTLVSALSSGLATDLLVGFAAPFRTLHQNSDRESLLLFCYTRLTSAPFLPRVLFEIRAIRALRGTVVSGGSCLSSRADSDILGPARLTLAEHVSSAEEFVLSTGIVCLSWVLEIPSLLDSRNSFVRPFVRQLTFYASSYTAPSKCD